MTLVIRPSGSPIEGQTYSLTCDLMGDELLTGSITERRFRWDRLTPSFQSAILRAATLTFNPLSLQDEGEYECTTSITSSYFTSQPARTQTFTVVVSKSVITYDCREGYTCPVPITVIIIL